MIEMIGEPPRLFLERFDISVHIFFPPIAIKPALVKRLPETVAKGASLALDPIQQPRHFAIR